VSQRIGHLARRFFGALSPAPPTPDDEAWATSQLTAGEVELWQQMANPDRRHAITVARRFHALRPAAARPEMAAALLHDVGKLDAGLGTVMRVVATLVGPRTDRFRRYHDHVAIGAQMLAAAGSDELTVALVGGEGPAGAAAALAAADDV
jgi:hypothetical protein